MHNINILLNMVKTQGFNEAILAQWNPSRSQRYKNIALEHQCDLWAVNFDYQDDAWFFWDDFDSRKRPAGVLVQRGKFTEVGNAEHTASFGGWSAKIYAAGEHDAKLAADGTKPVFLCEEQDRLLLY